MKTHVMIAAIGLVLLIGMMPECAALAAVPSGEPDCSECHVCKTPTTDDPCLKLCPRGHASEQAVLDHGPEICVLNDLEQDYEAVIFQHRLHANMSVLGKGCTDCHHYAEAGITACNTCHARTVSHEHLSQPGLKGAYHRQCLGCHKEWSGDTNCEICHAKKSGESGVAMTPPQRFYPTLEEPVKKVWESAYGGGTKVTLHHRAHTESYGIDCASCHHAEGCKSCHSRGETTMQVRHSEEALHAICNQCHQEMSCNQCHLKQEAPEFTHDRTGWPLSRYHRNLACRSCHGNPYHFSKPSASCNTCHATWTTASFTHSKTGLELNETHRDFECTECHANRNFAATPTCSTCHESDITYPAAQPGSYVNRKS